MTQAKVGIFFVVNGDLVVDAVPLEQGVSSKLKVP